jgi:hypothetical protein
MPTLFEDQQSIIPSQLTIQPGVRYSIGFVVGGLLEETGWRGYALPPTSGARRRAVAARASI